MSRSRGIPRSTRRPRWIDDLATACGCHRERILRHSGQPRRRSQRYHAFGCRSNAQAAIMATERHRREREFRTQFMDTEPAAPCEALGSVQRLRQVLQLSDLRAGPSLLEAGLALENGVHLRIYGLDFRSALGANGRDDTRESLYLSPLQTTLDPVDDVVNLVIVTTRPTGFPIRTTWTRRSPTDPPSTCSATSTASGSARTTATFG